MSRRLRILSVSPFPPSPPTFGAQRRIQGLLSSLSRRHDVDAAAFVPPYLDPRAARRGMKQYCGDVVVLPSGPTAGLKKRAQQLRSMVSRHSFEHNYFAIPAMQGALDGLLTRRRYDVVNVEFCFLSHFRLRQAPAGQPPPAIVLDEHNVEFDLARQMTGLGRGVGRHVHNLLNWRKLRDEELDAWRSFDGVAFTSTVDEERARAAVPSLRSRVVPNAVDVEFFRPPPGKDESDGCTVLFFGTFNYFPNRDGVLYLLREVWPKLLASHPRARLAIIGADPPPEVVACRGPHVDVLGQVEDVRPHLTRAAVAVAPLLVGGGTRLKIVEAMAMAKPVVSTSSGAEGITATPEQGILLADDPIAFAAAVGRLLDDPALRGRLGKAARTLVEARFSWDVAAQNLESLFLEVLDGTSSSSSRVLG